MQIVKQLTDLLICDMLLFFSISLFVGEERGLVFVLEVTATV